MGVTDDWMTDEHKAAALEGLASNPVAQAYTEGRRQLADLRGRAAYEAYCACTGGVSAISGARLPTWEEQRPDIREAWRAAADAAVMIAELGPGQIRAEDGDAS